MLTERKGLIVWVSDTKAARALEKYGVLHYVSKRMKYAVLYVNADKADEICAQLKRIHFVKKIEPSYRNELRTEYTKNVPDKTRFYTY